MDVSANSYGFKYDMQHSAHAFTDHMHSSEEYADEVRTDAQSSVADDSATVY